MDVIYKHGKSTYVGILERAVPRNLLNIDIYVDIVRVVGLYTKQARYFMRFNATPFACRFGHVKFVIAASNKF
jgi:hypothetical protein